MRLLRGEHPGLLVLVAPVPFMKAVEGDEDAGVVVAERSNKCSASIKLRIGSSHACWQERAREDDAVCVRDAGIVYRLGCLEDAVGTVGDDDGARLRFNAG